MEMEFRVEFLDYGRYGVSAREPRTGLCAGGRTREEARAEITRLLREYDGYLPPDDGPDRSIEIIRV